MITVIDYGLGNLASVANALGKLEIPYRVLSDIDALENAKVLILPGVGAAGHGMENLKNLGMDKVLIEHAKKGTPILGICLGMQLLLSSSEEGNVTCLELLEGNVRKFNTSLKVPQIGWNQVECKNNSKLLKGINNNSSFYFVNSFYCDSKEESLIKGTTDYGITFCSVLEKDNLYGVQFHPEKSGDVGLQLLLNFWEAVW
ncbi:MAG TPA: imidazole glycerol phosphate synthase subunit HisH [Candidatus Sulfotelmatobacter sp.]|jgi:glutamine amidotransferase|nr:imidazole glycerol phosphate synthase subunit HisH [Candidatus Sulfotelmatobacter sp.]